MPSPIKKTRIVEEITAKIRSGELQPGDQLPTSPALMEQYATSVVTVRGAIAELKAAGLVEFVPGAGVFVRRQD